MMRWLCLVLSLAFAAPLRADVAEHPVTLWRVQGESNVVYLLGSIHMLRQQDYPLPRAIDAAYDDAERLIMELDMDDLDNAAVQAMFNSAGVLQNGKTLQDLMGEDAWQQATVAAAAIDIPIEMLASSEPWLAAITVEMMMLYRAGFNPLLGVEMTMLSRALNDGKPIDGLETAAEQLSFLDGLSLEAQRDMLLQTLEDSADIDTMIDTMINAWQNGDVATLEAGLLDSIEQYPELHEALVSARNREWAESIETLLDDDDDYLVIVGALHLVGDDGVPNLLAGKGLAVRQLSEPPPLK
jgi:uncharacterized protein YbaP (TraB family)